MNLPQLSGKGHWNTGGITASGHGECLSFGPVGCVQHCQARYPWESYWADGKIQSSVPPPAELEFREGGELVLAINICTQPFPKIIINE